MQLIEVLGNIPLVLQYFMPGYLTLSLFLYLSSKKIAELQSKYIALVVSYLILTFAEVFVQRVGALNFMRESVLMKSALAFILGIVCAVLMALIFKSECFSKILVRIFNKTPNDDIWMFLTLRGVQI